MSIKLGIDGPREGYTHLVLQFLETIDPAAFKVNKAGNYFYINPKPLLDELEIQYKNKNIMYEMISLNEEKKLYKLVKKEVKVAPEN